MKLAEILQKPVFDAVQVIAGHSGLNKEIKNITMMDAPDIVEYLHPNDLLVTTAYHLKDDIFHKKQFNLRMKKAFHF